MGKKQNLSKRRMEALKRGDLETADKLLEELMPRQRRDREAHQQEKEALRARRSKKLRDRNTYTVQEGDNFFSVADEVLGDMRLAGALIEANPNVYSLFSGMTLNLPGADAGAEEPAFFSEESYQDALVSQEVTAAIGGDPSGARVMNEEVEVEADEGFVREGQEALAGLGMTEDALAGAMANLLTNLGYSDAPEARPRAVAVTEADTDNEGAEVVNGETEAVVPESLVQVVTEEQEKAEKLLDTWFQNQVADMKITGPGNYREVYDEYVALQSKISQGDFTYSDMWRKVYGKEYVPTPTPTPIDVFPTRGVTVIPLDTATPEPSATPEATEEPNIETPLPIPTPEYSEDFLGQYAPISGDGFRVTVNYHGRELPKGLHPGYDIVANDFNLKANVSGEIYFFQTLWTEGEIQTRAFDPKLGYPENDESYEDFGNYAVLVSEINGETYYQVFSHLATFSQDLQNGDEVIAGTPFGIMGDTGAVDPAEYHVHWEIRTENGVNIDENGVIRLDTFERVLADGTYPNYYAQTLEELEQFTMDPYEFAVLLNSLDNQ